MTAPDQQPHPPETFGCHYGCEFFSDSGVLSPEYCKHPSFEKPRKIIGFSSKSCEIPRGKTRPEWCPLCGVCKAAIAAAAIAEDRKRPRPPCEECNWQARIDAARAEGAREERESVLPKLILLKNAIQFPTDIPQNCKYLRDCLLDNCRDCIINELIESLRSHQPGGEDGGAGE